MDLKGNPPPRRRCATLAGALLLATGLAPAFANEAAGPAQGCARQFEAAQRIDMESFRDYDADAFRAIHANNAVTVFASGHSFIGIDNIMAVLGSHFANREAVWSWKERYRVVDGCKSAYILYETTYAIPRIGLQQHALTGVTYSHVGGAWLAIADQGTPLPPP